MGNRKGIYGVGINDSTYPVRNTVQVEGKQVIIWECPIFVTWKDMLKRVFSDSYHKKSPTYKECTVTPEWLSFMNFHEWVGNTNLKGVEGTKLALDKDIFLEGNKHYCPEYCNLVEPKVNNFMLDGGKHGDYPRGLSYNNKRGVLQVFCSDPFKIKTKFISDVKSIEDGLHLYYKTKRGYLKDLLNKGYTNERLYKIIDDRLLRDLEVELGKL